jgi:hypothetical protein
MVLSDEGLGGARGQGRGKEGALHDVRARAEGDIGLDCVSMPSTVTGIPAAWASEITGPSRTLPRMSPMTSSGDWRSNLTSSACSPHRNQCDD